MIIKGLLSPPLLEHAKKKAHVLKQKYPYPGYLHPIYKDLRPQRIPEKNWTPEDMKDKKFFWSKISKLASKTLIDNLPYPVDIREQYLIYYPKNTLMHEHTDPAIAPYSTHWRVGVVIEQQCVGGDLILEGQELVMNEGDAYIFKACTQSHAVTRIISGKRLVFTMAAYVNENNNLEEKT